MTRRPWAGSSPVVRHVAWERRAFLRACGFATGGMTMLGSGALAGCGDEGAGEPAARGTSTTPRAAPGVEPYDPDRPYWEQGNFRAVTTEATETDLEISGALPPELSGLYVRNGSNPASGSSPHWFLGDGMVHGVRLSEGRATWYRNRWVRTTLYEGGMDLADAGAPGRDVNQSNVAIVHHGGRLLTLGEVGWPYELVADDLSTAGPWDFGGDLTTAMTAHPKIHPDTGDMHLFGYGFTDPLLTYHVADPSGHLVRSEEIPIPAATMIHDFAITDRDAVFWLGPVMFGVSPDMPVPDFPYYWDPEGPCRVGVMPLEGPASAIRWVDIDPCMVFHGLNAHRDGDEVVLRVHRTDSAFGPEGDLLPSHLTEWRVDTGGDRLGFRSRQLSDVNMDLPTHDRRRTGRDTAHGWFTTIDRDGPYGFELAGLNHLDLHRGREDRWEPGPMERAGEAFFVPGDESAGEGEGWLLTFLYDRTVDRSSLGVFDAGAVADGPVARVHLPVRVPYGFHGLWVPEADLRAG